jgi:hypothetical protein
MYNPVRRNRNIGTSKSGQGQNNRMVIPSGQFRLNKIVTKSYEIHGNRVQFIIEPTLEGCVYSCSPDEVAKVLAQLPVVDVEGIELVVFHQPTKKQNMLSPNWASYQPNFEYQKRQVRAILLTAINPTAILRWPKSLSVDDRNELERLKKEGHDIEATARGYLIKSNLPAIRRTQLQRSLLHEVGHHVGQKKLTLDNEKFADAYAAKHHASLIK